jgi:hypothetical protein
MNDANSGNYPQNQQQQPINNAANGNYSQTQQ